MILNVVIYDNGIVISTTNKGRAAREYSGSLPVLHKLLADYDSRYKVDKAIRDFLPTDIITRFATTNFNSSVGNSSLNMSEPIKIEALRDFTQHIKRK